MLSAKRDKQFTVPAKDAACVASTYNESLERLDKHSVPHPSSSRSTDMGAVPNVGRSRVDRCSGNSGDAQARVFGRTHFGNRRV